MKSLFIRMYLGIILALFIGIFISEYLFNKGNYEEDLLEEHYYAVDNIHGYLIDDIQHEKNSEIPLILDKWQDISGYDISLVRAANLTSTVHAVLSRSKKKAKLISIEIQSPSFDDIWVGTDTDFFEDRTLIIAPYPAKGLWLAFSSIEVRTSEDNRVFIVNQLSLLFVFSLALIIFLWPIVNTINRLNEALTKFKEGELDVSVPVKGPKPLALLNQQFNKMASTLKNKMQEQELMTSAMSHELKTPITRLRFALDMAVKSESIEDRNELLSEMDIDLTELDNLTTELLTLAKVAGGSRSWQYSKINYRELIEQEIEKMCRHQPSINIEVFGDAYGIACAPHMFRVISNVIGNAYKYARLNIYVSLKQQDGRCFVTIEDDGEGIADQDRDKLFVPFYRANTSRNSHVAGHGIGLAICWNIIQHHQGDIQVDRSPLGGLRMCICLPVDPRDLCVDELVE